MAWSKNFTDSLNSPSKKIEYGLLFMTGSNNAIYNNSEFLSESASTRVYLGEANVTIENVRVTPSRWSLNFGGFTVEVLGDLRKIDGSVFVRGAIAELHMLRDGQFTERVAMGQLRSVSGGRGKWIFQFGDILSAMNNRFIRDSNDSHVYYNDIERRKAKVTISFDYSIDPKLYVDKVNVFQKGTNNFGMVRVTNPSGNTFYYLYSAAIVTSGVAGYLLIVNNGYWPSITTNNILSVGSKVESIVFLEDKPHQIFFKTFMSTGQGTQGPFDTFPAQWGSGLPFSPDIIDSYWDYLEFYAAIKPSSGEYKFSISFDEPKSEGFRFLLDKFLNCGMWPVFRQNAFSFRCCQNPYRAASGTIQASIFDKDIIQVESHHLFSPSQSVSYMESVITYYKALTNQSLNLKKIILGRVTDLPKDTNIIRDNRFIYKLETPDQNVLASKDLDRMAIWDLQTYEELVITVREFYAILVAGDIVEITSSDLYGVMEAEGKTYQQKRAMVLGVRWQPNQSRCILTLGMPFFPSANS